MKETTRNMAKEGEKQNTNAGQKMPKDTEDERGKSMQQPSQLQDDSQNLTLVAECQSGKWNISESPPPTPPPSSSLGESEQPQQAENQTLRIALPKGACLTVRLREELRKPEDGTSPYRVVYKFPAPETELAAPTTTTSAAASPAQSQSTSSEAKQSTTNEHSAEEQQHQKRI